MADSKLEKETLKIVGNGEEIAFNPPKLSPVEEDILNSFLKKFNIN